VDLSEPLTIFNVLILINQTTSVLGLFTTSRRLF
jgi:hypothetical protein